MHSCKHTYIIYMKWKNRFRCSYECLSSVSWNAREMLCTRKRRFRYTAPVLCKYESVYLILVVSCLQHILRSPSFLEHFLSQHQPLEEAIKWCLKNRHFVSCSICCIRAPLTSCNNCSRSGSTCVETKTSWRIIWRIKEAQPPLPRLPWG